MVFEGRHVIKNVYGTTAEETRNKGLYANYSIHEFASLRHHLARFKK